MYAVLRAKLLSGTGRMVRAVVVGVETSTRDSLWGANARVATTAWLFGGLPVPAAITARWSTPS
jgi:hypothetical protein